MSNIHEEMPEGHLHWTDGEYDHGRAEVWKTIWILSAVTVIEVLAALTYDHLLPTANKLPINFFVAICSVIKVYFIMGTFMHLKHETKGFFMTIAMPFMFLIWAIIAFSCEGGSWNAMRSLLNVF